LALTPVKSTGSIKGNHDRSAISETRVEDCLGRIWVCWEVSTLLYYNHYRNYIELLETVVIVFAEDIYGDEWIFQQNNKNLYGNGQESARI